MQHYDSDTRYIFNGFARNYVATSSVMYEMAELQCRWLGDIVASYREELKGKDYFKVVECKLNGGGGCVVAITTEPEGIVVRQDVPFTDLTRNVKWWLVSEGDLEILMKPEDY